MRSGGTLEVGQIVMRRTDANGKDEEKNFGKRRRQKGKQG